MRRAPVVVGGVVKLIGQGGTADQTTQKKCHRGFECIVHKFECRMQQIFIQNQAVILYETLKGFKAIS